MDERVDCECAFCGEPLAVPVDPSAGARQSFVQDCAVCCSPNVVSVEIDPEGAARARAEGEGE